MRERGCCLAVLLPALACGGGSSSTVDAGPPIPHVVILVLENHTFDSYFGRWCTAPAGSNPTCTAGPGCCEAAPAVDPEGNSPLVLDDTSNAAYDRDHYQACELTEIDDGGMDHFTAPVTDAGCADPRNFSIADSTSLATYYGWATQYAVADRYFQPLVGQSSSNDVYLATAHYMFTDNDESPDGYGLLCTPLSGEPTEIDGGHSVADILLAAGHTWAWYGEGYDIMKAAGETCPLPPSACPLALPVWPCLYSPSDNPFLFFDRFDDNSEYDKDYVNDFGAALSAGTLPDVSYVKPLGYKTEHPGYGDTISAGETFASAMVSAIQGSSYAQNTLILITWDEGGGFYDHVPPPRASSVDGEPYGTRVPLLALGPYAKKGFVSHVTMEHSSIVKFLEWNYTGATGQLGTRDAVVANIGSLLDPTATKVQVPED
jgi:phospholipase C